LSDVDGIRKVGGQSEVGLLQRVLLKHPREAFPPEEILGVQWRELGYHRKPDLSRASDEHDALVGLLEGLGVTVDLLPADADTTMDSLYVRDASILTDGGIILCNMGKPARRGEPRAQEEACLISGIPILGRIEGSGRLEGGDFIWLTPDTAAVGRGYRTNDEGIHQLRNLLARHADRVVVVPLPHWRGPSDVFHLMSVISPIDRDLALVYSPLLPVPFREFLLYSGVSLVEVPEGEFHAMGCNVLAVAPRVCVMLEGNPVTRRLLEDQGAEVYTYRGEEISVPGEGGPTCLTRPTLRRP
jgi:N-dimethylarginine dimethylaminohydrolase